MAKTYINVPYSEKEEAKALGAKWDMVEKKWWCLDKDSQHFQKWLNPQPNQNKTLTIELVPSTCWFSNVRNHISSAEWNKVKKHTFTKANYRCEVCNGVGHKHPVECHELWHYDDTNHIQTLTGTIALCPDCHTVKHMGLAQIRGVGVKAERWLAKVNNWDNSKTSQYVAGAFSQWRTRSRYDWTLNIDWLNETFGLEVKPER